jgi:cobyrinic acid a,c-diamide synthase
VGIATSCGDGAANPFFREGGYCAYEFTTPGHPIARGAYAFRVQRGFGFDGEHDGLCQGSVLATYTHLHALSAPGWAPAVVQAAHHFRAAPLISAALAG